MFPSRSGRNLNPLSISIDGINISTTPNISVTPWTAFTTSFIVYNNKMIVVKISGTIFSIDESAGIDNVTTN